MRKEDRDARGRVRYKNEESESRKRRFLTGSSLFEEELLKLHGSHCLILQVIHCILYSVRRAGRRITQPRCCKRKIMLFSWLSTVSDGSHSIRLRLHAPRRAYAFIFDLS